MLAVQPPFWMIPGTDGLPLNGGSVYFGAVGQNPETQPVTAYWDSALTQQASQPIKTQNGLMVRNGLPAVLYLASDYSMTVRDANGGLVLYASDSSQFSLASQVVQVRSDFASDADGKGDALVTVKQPYTGAVERSQHAKNSDTVSVLDFGAVGDGATDDTTDLKNALTAAAGRILSLEQNKTYLVTDELVMSDGTVLLMNGSTLSFAVTGSKRCLAMGNNCHVAFGSIANTIGTSGLEGTYQTPVTVGQYTSLTGCSDVVVRNLSITSATPNGNGIAIFGDSNNVTVENITFPDSSTLAIGVLAHWSFNGGSTTPYTGTTTHPRNLKINNIKAGTWTNGTSGDIGQSLVFLSACYNVEVANIYADLINHGKAVTVYAGDWGFQFATSVEQVMGLCGISVKNVFGRYLMGVHVYGKNTLQATVKVWPGSVTLDNVCVYGITSDTESKGLRAEGCDNVTARHCVFDSFYSAVYLGGVVTNFSLADECSLRQSVTHALDGTGLLAGSGAITVRNTKFIGTNTSAAASKGDIDVVNVAGMTIRDSRFDSSNATWNVRADNTCSRLKVIDNHTYNVSGTGPAYSFGGSADTAICTEFRGNTCDDVPTSGLRGGQVYIPALLSAANGVNDIPAVVFAPSMPDRGTWSKGTMSINSAPAVGSPKGFLRLTTGSGNVLNTDWVSMGNL